MRKYTYCFLILDEEGNTIAERNLSPEQAIDLLVQPEHIEIVGVPAITPDVPPRKKGGRPKKTAFEKAAESTRVGRGKHPVRPPTECCGSTGSRHFKTCQNFAPAKKYQKPFAQPDSLPASVAVRRSLTAEEYADLRYAMHDKEFQSAEYSYATDLSLTEINNAIAAKSYADYLDQPGVQ